MYILISTGWTLYVDRKTVKYFNTPNVGKILQVSNSELLILWLNTSWVEEKLDRVGNHETVEEARVQDCPSSQPKDKEFLCRYSLKKQPDLGVSYYNRSIEQTSLYNFGESLKCPQELDAQ